MKLIILDVFLLRLSASSAVITLFAYGSLVAEGQVSGDAVIRAWAGGSEIIITTTSRCAGAIHSLTWNGKEFIDSADHGRQLQSASNFDAGKQPFFPETFNPTEAGSARDGAGKKSTSKLLELRAKDNELVTKSLMAFWLAPGEKSQGHPALNGQKLSDHLLTKHVRIGFKEWKNVLDYRVTFTIPKNERHNYAQFEALTGYMPPDFSRFETLDPKTGKLEPLDDGPGEQSRPVVFSTESGGHAMGIFSPDQPSRDFKEAGYGRFRFRAEKVVKWNCVFRVKDDSGVKSGEYSFRMFVPIGTREDVRLALVALQKEFDRR
ncbi:MAG: hypothetical protein K8R36_14885 [Planctomycetales bacterium]|nr:hypothetical protein [Planctomycetales bacterium]